MKEVKYLFRDESAAVCLLEDGGRQIASCCQIVTAERTLVRPDYLGEYAAIGTFAYKSKTFDTRTDTFEKMERLGMRPGRNYVAKIDSEMEFLITDRSLERLTKYLPCRTMADYSMLLDGLTSGVLLFIRVYETETIFPEWMLQNNSAWNICALHDADGEDTSVMVKDPVPIVPKNQFLYIKNQILNQFKIDGTYIAEYSNTEEDKENLRAIFADNADYSGVSARFRKAIAQYEATGYAISEDEEYDRAQLDYEEIFKNVLEVCPEMQPIIDYARTIQAARLHEYEYYLKDVHGDLKKSKNAVKRLFDMSLRSAIKVAYYKYRDNGMDLEDAFQEACIGILMAIEKHSDDIQVLFPSYVSVWMTQVIGRDMPNSVEPLRTPVHIRDEISTIKKNIEKQVGKIDYQTISQEKLTDIIANYGEVGGEEDKPSVYARTMTPIIHYDEYDLSDEEIDIKFSDNDDFEREMLDQIYENDSLAIVVRTCNEVCTKREKEVIYHRYFDINPKTLEDTGAIYGVTRERVRQIEAKAFRKMRNRVNSIKIFASSILNTKHVGVVPALSITSNTHSIISDFKLGKDRKTIISCPNGCRPVRQKYSSRFVRTDAWFSNELSCNKCPIYDKCPGKHQKNETKVSI